MLAYSNAPVYGVHITNMRIYLAPFLGWINVNAKPKTELSISVFMQNGAKRISVNGVLVCLIGINSKTVDFLDPGFVFD